jgi:hypothetical protein
MDELRSIGFGCVSLTKQPFLGSALDLLRKAYDVGITHFDTAPVYGNGYSEKILGAFIRNRRRNVTVTTKCGMGSPDPPTLAARWALPLHALKQKLAGRKSFPATFHPPAMLEYRVIGEEYVMRSLNASLNNLQTDYIDYYLLHEALPAFLTPQALSFLMEQQRKGVIRQLGIAAAYINLLPLRAEDITGWDILQYENGLNYPTNNILDRFTGKSHFYHSSLKFLQSLPSDRYSPNDWAGILLNRAVKINPSGKVLFATTKVRTIEENIRAFKKFGDLPLREINDMIHAVH